jgi:hypothetical protein
VVAHVFLIPRGVDFPTLQLYKTELPECELRVHVANCLAARFGSVKVVDGFTVGVF